MDTEYTGKKIAEFRKAKGLTQKELAAKIHVTDKAVSKWERGINFPDLGLMEELANVLETTPSILLGLENATKEEVVTSFVEISNSQAEDAEKDIQKIGWLNLFVGIFLIVFMHFINIKLQRNGLFFESQTLLWMIYGLLSVVIIGAVYILRKYRAIKKWEDFDVIVAEVLVVDVIIFLGIQLFTSTNPNLVISSILISTASVCLELLFYRMMKPQWMKALPLVLMSCWMCYVVLLELAQAAWMDTNIGELVIYAVLPFASSLMTWFLCRKRSMHKEKLMSGIKLAAITIGVMIVFITAAAPDLLMKIYVKCFHEQMENYALELLAECEYTTSDYYGMWKVMCYPEDKMVEFYIGGAGIAADSSYEGLYYSADNVHKAFQGADVRLNINKNLADWYEEGDNWGRSTRLIEKWFWYEAHF